MAYEAMFATGSGIAHAKSIETELPSTEVQN
jgi:hypothetical protein